MVKKVDVLEEVKLRWPDGAERTRIKDRVGQNRWRESWTDTKKRLSDELQRLGATSILITRAEDQRLDPGVAVWFSRVREDFSWQQGLGLDNPAPSLAEVDAAFRDRARKVHPDNPTTGDPEAFKRLSEWHKAARAWITGSHAHAHEYVMAIDQYNESRLNLKALQMAFFYIRRLEDVGAPAILSQTLGAFRAKLTGGSDGSAL
jgi:hypothetical protein